MTKGTVFITGINSFVGRELAQHLKQKGYVVKGSLSSLKKSKAVSEVSTDITKIDLSEDIESEAIPNDIDILVYAAHDKRNSGNNLTGNKAIYEISQRKGCRRHVYISSISANSSNNSDYGRVKLELERFFLEKDNSVILRPGLIIGNGGLYSSMSDYIKRSYLVPLPDGGKYKMAVVKIDDLCSAIEHIFEGKLVGTFNLYQGDLLSLRDIVNQIASDYKRRVFILHIPIDITVKILKFFSIFFKIFNFTFSVDSIEGYSLYKYMKLPQSDLPNLINDKDRV